jgi:hypothetical protein
MSDVIWAAIIGAVAVVVAAIITRPWGRGAGPRAIAFLLILAVVGTAIYIVYKPQIDGLATATIFKDTKLKALTSITMVSRDEGWAVGNEGTIMHYDGTGWKEIEEKGTISTNTLFSVQMVPVMGGWKGWAVGDGGIILKYDQGEWSEDKSPTSDRLFCVYMSSDKEGWAVGRDNNFHATILHYTAASGWTVWSKADGPFLLSVFMVSPDEGWAVGASGIVRHYSGGKWDAGAEYSNQILTWVQMNQSGSNGWAVGYRGTILQYSSGNGWIPYTSNPMPTTQQLHEVREMSDGSSWAVDNAGSILQYKDGLWSQVYRNADGPLNSISMTSANEGWAVGGDYAAGGEGFILHSQNGVWSKTQYQDGAWK